MAEVARYATNAMQTSSMDEPSSRPKSSEESKKGIWSSMLDNVASGKRLPEKSILVLGGNYDSQREFLDSLSQDPSGARRQLDRRSDMTPPIANQFALGYTYRDVLDTDHEDTLARLSIYLLAEPSAAFMPLVRPLLTPQNLSNMLVVILLDWGQPWTWIRQLRSWMQLLRYLLVSLDDDCKEVMQDVMVSWRDRGRGGNSFDGNLGGSVPNGEDVSLPLGPGEWDEALGIPVSIVCQNAEKMDLLEKEHGWKDDEFDFVLQFLRTILLKHGASLIYTSVGAISPLQSLIYSSLGIQSLLKKQPLKHNIIDRDRILIPPNWDSWGKVRLIRDGFDVEAVSDGWSVEIDEPFQEVKSGNSSNKNSSIQKNGDVTGEEAANGEGPATSIYESVVHSPHNRSDYPFGERNDKGIEVESLDAQEFLASQLDVLQRLKAEDDPAGNGKDSRQVLPSRQTSYQTHDGERDEKSGEASDATGTRVNEHIGPVQFNVGGIQVDADDMLKKLKDREANRTPEADVTASVGSPDGKSQNEALASFFAGLINRSGNKNSPKTPHS